VFRRRSRISKTTVRRLLKFLHTLAASGLTGAIAALAVVMILAPASTSAPGYLPIMVSMAKIAAWSSCPSMVLTIITGLLSIAATPGFQDAGWVWAKAATGILILEGGLHVLGPIQDEAKRGADALASGPDAGGAASLLTSEVNTLWVLLAVSIANIALGVWRPRFPRIPF
jgi:uncharacterized membrane protein